MTLLVLYNRFMDSERERKEKEKNEKEKKEKEKEEREKEEGKGGFSHPVECPICLRSIGDVDCYVTKCGHKFHGSCMLNWCEIRRDSNKEEVCPLCRGQLKNNINFPGVTKKLVHDFLRILGSHDAPRDAVGEEVLWMRLPAGCQQELIETLEYHYFINEQAIYLGGGEGQGVRMPYNFSLSDLNFHL